jgi:hypothetical protein
VHSAALLFGNENRKVKVRTSICCIDVETDYDSYLMLVVVPGRLAQVSLTQWSGLASLGCIALPQVNQ